MSYNDGQVHTEIYDGQVDIEKIAGEFSEGDPNLQKVLMALWGSGVKTTACCKGHGDGRFAYLSFMIDDKSKQLIQATSEYLYLQDGKIELSFVSGSKDYDVFIVTMGDEKSKEDYYNFINIFLSQKDIHEESNNSVLEYGNYLLEFARKFFLNCRFDVGKNDMMFGFSRPGVMQIFNDNCPVLDDIITSIKETGNIPLIPLKCSEKALQEFINIIHPNAFEIHNTIRK